MGPAALCLGLSLALSSVLAGCSGESAPELPRPEALSATEEAACDALLADLPEGIDPSMLVCGAPEPPTLEPTSECDEVLGVDWFVDPDAFSDEGSGIVVTAIGVRPRVAVAFAPDERGNRSLEVLSLLGEPVREHLERVSRCR